MKTALVVIAIWLVVGFVLTWLFGSAAKLGGPEDDIIPETSYWRKQGFNDKKSLRRAIAIAGWVEQAELEEGFKNE